MIDLLIVCLIGLPVYLIVWWLGAALVQWIADREARREE